MAQLNEEAVKTSNDNSDREKELKAKIKELKQDAQDLKKEMEHRERCYRKIQKDNDDLRNENSKMEHVISGTHQEESQRMQIIITEKDRQI